MARRGVPRRSLIRGIRTYVGADGVYCRVHNNIVAKNPCFFLDSGFRWNDALPLPGAEAPGSTTKGD